MPPKKSVKARKRPQAEANRSPSPSRPAKQPRLSSSSPPSPEEKKTRKSNKPDEGCPGWWPPEYAPAGKLLPANKAGMRKVIKAFQDANRDPAELWSEGGMMVQLVRQDPVGRIHQRIFDKIDFENLVPKTPSHIQIEETPSSESEQATLDRENTEPTPEPLTESITIAASSVLETAESIVRQPQTTERAKPVSATIDTLRNGDGLDSQDMTRCANLFPCPSDWYIFPPGSSFTVGNKIHAQHPALKARHIAFFVYSQDEDQWALCHLDVGKATLVHHLTNHLTKMPAEELVDWLRSQRKLNMKGMMFVKQPGPIHRDSPSGGIYALIFLKCLMAKERVPRFVDIATARMEFIKMIGSADATKRLTSTQDAGLDVKTIPTEIPNDQAIPVDPQLQAPSFQSNTAESSTPKTQELTIASPRLTAKKSEQIVLIPSSESSPDSIPSEPEFGEPTDDEAVNTKSANNSRSSETNTPPSDPDDPLAIAQCLEVNFTAFLNQRRKLEACVEAEKSSAKKNDETIAELKQARQELIEKHSRGTSELRRKVSELEINLEAAKRALENAERAEKESNVGLAELGDKIRGEERSKAEAGKRIKQWEATLAKTAFQSM